jgi:hypothetical protein
MAGEMVAMEHSWADVELDVPGTGHGRLRFSGGWPDVETLIGLAVRMAESTRHCLDCDDVPTEEFLLAMIKAAPVGLAAELRERTGLRPEPSPAERALAETYARYAGELAAIEVLRRGRRSA